LDGSQLNNLLPNHQRLISSHDQTKIISNACLNLDRAQSSMLNDSSQIDKRSLEKQSMPLVVEDSVPLPCYKKSRSETRVCITERDNGSTSLIHNEQLQISRHSRNHISMEYYPNVPNEIFDTYNIKRYMPTIAFRDRVRQLTTGPALLFFLRNGYRVYIKRSDGKLYPCLYETNDIGNLHVLLNYGKRYPAADICADARLLHKDRVHAPIHTSEFSGNIIVLTQKYKQRPDMINAVLDSLNKYNAQQMCEHLQQVPNTGFGEYGGRISIMGSGGSNTVLGRFAPTTKCHKNDPLVVIGMGQKCVSRINKTLDELATNQSVRAIFLNEKCYGSQSTENKQGSSSLRFIGYYQFNESRFVNGDKHEDVAKEFNNPSPLEWENLTFRLHPHLRLEASPFIPSLNDVHQLITKGSSAFQKIVISHDDHSDIMYCVPHEKDWKESNYEVSIEDVIADMISSGEFDETHENEEENEEENGNGDQDYTDDTYLELTDCNSFNNTSINNCVRQRDVDEDDNKEASDINTEYVGTAESDSCNSTEEILLRSTSSYNNKELDDTDDEEEYSNGNQENTDLEYNDFYSSTDTSSHDLSESASDDDDMKIQVPSQKPSVATHCINGTSASIADVVCCNVFCSSVCSMRYNKKTLRDVDGKLCAAPLMDTLIGTCLRIKPIPSPNRALDVNLCYLREAFKEHTQLHLSMSLNQRCDATNISTEILAEMLFQTVVFRFTGRIFRFEQYRKYCSDRSSSLGVSIRSIPFRKDHTHFLDYVRDQLEQKQNVGMGSWISRQHYGSIANKLKQNYKSFREFVDYVLMNVATTVGTIKFITKKDIRGNRTRCVTEIQKLLENAMDMGSVCDYGRVQWMAHSVVCDIEEFVIDPFGDVDDLSDIPEGNYSTQGHDIVQRERTINITYKECLDEIVSYVYNEVPKIHLSILGYTKERCTVLNVVNGRPFTVVDAEHFLCKAWLVASSCFGSARLSNYPRLCNAHTHPSPIIHAMADTVIDCAMDSIEAAYCLCTSTNSQRLVLPEFIRLPGDELVGKEGKECDG
jgi:hypothetical protein